MKVYRPAKGYADNPLRDCARNITCFICNSGKKIKKCCASPMYIKVDVAERLTEYIEGLDLDCQRAIGWKGVK